MDLLDRFLAQVSAIPSVWMPFVLTSAIVALILWRVLDWHYKGRIETLQSRLALRDERSADEARRQLERAAQPATATASPAAPKQPTPADITILIHNASQSAGWALGSGSLKTYESATPGMKSTLLTLKKYYQIDIPDLDGIPPKTALEVGSMYLTEVGAFLRQGHLEEARERASAIAQGLDERWGGR